MKKKSVHTIVIGASQAGLAMGYYLQQHEQSFLIIDKANYIGESWKTRYDSLVLFTPRSYSSLPGLHLSGDPNGFPTKDEIAAYLANYAKQFSLPVQLNTEVLRLEKIDHKFHVHTDQGEIIADQVVVATGPFQKPAIPSIAGALSESIFQIHSSQYRNTTQLADGAALIVGGGNSGAQIAVELAQDRKVYLSTSHKLRFLPLEILRKSIFWWFDHLGILKAKIDSKLGTFISNQPDPIFGKELKDMIKLGKIVLKPRTTDILEDHIHFTDQSSIKVNNVIWATGFIPDYAWMHIPKLLDANGKVVQQRGVTNIHGLYFLGLPWQYRRGSALIGGVGSDAKYLIEHMHANKGK